MAVGEADDAQRPLDLPARRVDAVHQKDGKSRIGRLEPFEQIEQEGGVVTVAGPYVLQFDDQGIEIKQLGLFDGRGHLHRLHARDHRPVQGMFRCEDADQVAAPGQAFKEILARVGMPGHLVAKQTQAPLPEHLVFLRK